MCRLHDGATKARREFDTERYAAANDYRRLFSFLTLKARRLGSTDPENAAQEALQRSLENETSQSAMEYFFRERETAGNPPEWPLSRLIAWLNGVLHRVVLEERNRVARRREILVGRQFREKTEETLDPPDPTPDQLAVLLGKELQQIVINCLPTLDAQSRKVLLLRAKGLKYSEVARSLQMNENTVATRVRRAMQTLSNCVRRRTYQQRRRLD